MSVEVVNQDGYTMTLEYYLAILPDDEFSPTYLFFETTLSTFSPFKEGLLISQWYKFYIVDEEKTDEKKQEEKERAELMGEEEQELDPHHIFYESVDGSIVHPGDGDFTIEDAKITQKCHIDEVFLTPCPWSPAPA